MSEVLPFFVLPFWLVFGWALLKVATNVWKAAQSLFSVFFMDPSRLIEPQNRKYFWITCGCMLASIFIVIASNVLFLVSDTPP